MGWQSTVAHEPQRTTVWACEKTVVMLKHPARGEEGGEHLKKRSERTVRDVPAWPFC